MNTALIKVDVQVLLEPEGGEGLLASQEYMENRKEGTGIIIQGFSPVCIPDGYAAAWVRNSDGTLAPYWYHEMTVLD